MTVGVPIGAAYIQNSNQDPGPVGFGYKWYKTDTGDEMIRNTSNTGWTLVGNNDQLYNGLLPRGGNSATPPAGVMTGAILGNSGLAPLAGADFVSTATVTSLLNTTSTTTYPVGPKINGVYIVPQLYVDAQDTYVLSQIQPTVDSAAASLTGVSITDNIVFTTGSQIGSVTNHFPSVTPDTYNIDPIVVHAAYADGSPVQQTDVSLIASTKFVNQITAGTGSFDVHCYLDPAIANKWITFSNPTPLGGTVPAHVNWFSIAVRPAT
jgi:hypothetical protein